MTRYEIARGLPPPPEEPKEYVMGVDIGVRHETVCAMCHREEGHIWVDRLDLIPPGKDALCHHLSSFNLKGGVVTDDHTKHDMGHVRRSLLMEGERMKFHPEVHDQWVGLYNSIRSKRWLENFSGDLAYTKATSYGVTGHSPEVASPYSDEIDALARAVWRIRERERPAPTLATSGGRRFTI